MNFLQSKSSEINRTYRIGFNYDLLSFKLPISFSLRKSVGTSYGSTSAMLQSEKD